MQWIVTQGGRPIMQRTGADFGRAGLSGVQDQVRSIDWLARSPELVVRLEAPAPSDLQIAVFLAATSHLTVKLLQIGARLLRRRASVRSA